MSSSFFPDQYTVFHSYRVDRQDYVMADDVNVLYDAVSKVEGFLGTRDGYRVPVPEFSGAPVPPTSDMPSLGTGQSMTVGHMLSYLRWAIRNASPVGSIVAFAGAASHVPDGWLICNGDPIDQKWQALRSLIGANTPNLVDRFIKGVQDRPATNTNLLGPGHVDLPYHYHALGGDHSNVLVTVESASSAHTHTISVRADSGHHAHRVGVIQRTPGQTMTATTGGTNPQSWFFYNPYGVKEPPLVANVGWNWKIPGDVHTDQVGSGHTHPLDQSNSGSHSHTTTNSLSGSTDAKGTPTPTCSPAWYALIYIIKAW
jgi:Phage Tail Collar Domain